MSPLAMNIAIAEHLGWHVLRPVINNCILARKSQKDGWSVPPNYAGDLNAMHEAEKKLSELERIRYVAMLRTIAPEDPGVEGWSFCHGASVYRASAFVRVIGKWKEEA